MFVLPTFPAIGEVMSVYPRLIFAVRRLASSIVIAPLAESSAASAWSLATAVPDYEVKDVMRRASTAELDVALALPIQVSSAHARLVFRGGKQSEPIRVQFTVSNLSRKPAEYAILSAYADKLFTISDPLNFHHTLNIVERFGRDCHSISANLGLPGSPPLFREYPEIAGSFAVSLPANQTFQRVVLGCEICTPGFVRRKLWVGSILNQTLYLDDGVDQPIE
jgi:hypothetical protein